MRIPLGLSILIRSLLLAGTPFFIAHATKPGHLIVEGYSDFSKGKCESVSLSDDGFLSPAPALSTVANLKTEQIWSVVLHDDGTFYVGTAPDGKLLKVDASHQVSEITKFKESFLYALASGPKADDPVFIGTSPDGKIYRLNAQGKPEVYFEPKEKYIWALLLAPDGSLFAATGTNGKIYHITGPKKGEVYYASTEIHIRSLAFDKTGALLAGSANSGYLYRITEKNSAAVLANTEKQEVNSISVAEDGSIYFTATGTAKSGSSEPGKNSSGNNSGSNDNPLGALRELLAAQDQGSKPNDGGGENKPDDSAKTANSQLYRLDLKNLYPQVIWEGNETALTLAWQEKEQRALVGTGKDGYIYAVTPRGSATRLLKVDSASITTSLLVTGQGVYLAACHPGKIYLISEKPSQPGVYLSDIFDSSGFAKWGSLAVRSSTPHQVHILTRTGNTAKPDATWYPWVELAHTEGTPIYTTPASPPARYMQVQLQLLSGSADRIDASYLLRNLAPVIKSINFLPVGLGYTPFVPPAPPLQAKAMDQLLSSDPNDSMMPKPEARWQPAEQHGMRTVAWKAVDPNDDSMTYSVSWRKQGETVWKNLAKDLTDPVLSWDTSGWADGHYELKITASDAPDNIPGEELTDEMITRDLIIDNTPPKIRLITQNDRTVEFEVSDDLSGLQSVTLSRNGKDYKPLIPVDGIIDSPVERFTAKINPSELLFIRAQDLSGNVASEQVQ